MPIGCVAATDNRVKQNKSNVAAPLLAGAIAAGLERTVFLPQDLKLANKVIRKGEDVFINNAINSAKETAEKIDKESVIAKAKETFSVLQADAKEATKAVNKHCISTGITIAMAVVAGKILSNIIQNRHEAKLQKAENK